MIYSIGNKIYIYIKFDFSFWGGKYNVEVFGYFIFVLWKFYWLDWLLKVLDRSIIFEVLVILIFD